MKKTINKWKTDKCGRCGEVHDNYTGKLDANGVEYVICGNTQKRMNVSGEGKEGNTFAFSTEWIKILKPIPNMIKIYESDSSIVYKGFNKKIIDEHILNKTQKILYVYDTKENLLCDELIYDSNYLAFYEILTETSDEFIIKRHIKLDEGIVEWKPIAGIRGSI